MSSNLRRADVNETIKMSLLAEVRSRCPLCNNELIVTKTEKTVRVFDIAHIYPLNATPHEENILKSEERLSDDIDCEKNFIPLCKKCHKVYDTQKTVQEYRELVAIKKNILKIKELREIWDQQSIHKDISIVVDGLSKLSEENIKQNQLSYDALKLGQKKDETLGLTNEFKISGYIVHFFIPIREAFKGLEKREKSITIFISTQVKNYYTLLLMKNFNQSQIFEYMSEWFMTNTGITDRSKAEALVSYFIQDCEVFSSVSTK